MNPNELAKAADPTGLATYLADLPRMQDADHGPTVSIREDDYRGHQILIKTSYEITVDGAPLQIPFSVSNDGQIHSHALPAYSFSSAVELIHKIIDNFPDDFTAGGQPSRPSQGDHGGHSV